MNETIGKLLQSEIQFVCSIEAECEKRNLVIKNEVDACKNIQQVEYLILDHVKFLGSVLQAMRKKNKKLKEVFGMSYGKLIGLATPYEEAIHSLRKVKCEFDQYLKIIRDEMMKKMKQDYEVMKKKRRNK